MSYSRIIYGNLFPALFLMALLALDRYNHLFDKRQSRRFRVAILSTLFLLVAISADYLLMQLEPQVWVWVLRKFTSFVNFAVSPVIPLFLYLIFSRKKVSVWYYLPCAINGTLCVLSMFWKLVFEINSNNAYGRGPLFFFPFMTSVVYLLILIVQMGRFGRKNKSSERIFLFFVILGMIGGMTMEIVLRYSFLTIDFAAFSLVFYYLLINVNNASSDPLTGALNRAMYMKELSEIRNNERCTIALMDINGFKQINDQLGHDVGDKILIRFVQIMQAFMEKGSMFYRIGGDEFAVISKRWDEQTLGMRLDEAGIRTTLEQFDFSYGLARYQPGLDLDEVLVLADKNMYVDKNRRKAQGSSPSMT